MFEQNKPSELQIRECLKSLGISLLGDWDVLVFLYRHQASLTSAEQIARLLGYPTKVVADALGRLESAKLVQRSRSSQGVRFYQLAFLEERRAPEDCLRQLMTMAEKRTGRLLLAKHLGQSTRLHIAAKGKGT
jgi:DNA-binding MarR family transcriptional regulator